MLLGCFPLPQKSKLDGASWGRAGGGAEATSDKPLTVCVAGVILSCDTVVLKNPKL